MIRAVKKENLHYLNLWIVCFFILFSLFTVLFGRQIPQNLQFLLLGFLAAFLGLPHGAFDFPKILASRNPVSLLVGYLILGLILPVVFFLDSFLWLIWFLALSGLHFSLSDLRAYFLPLREKIAEVWARSMIIFSAPAVLYGDQLTLFFSVFVDEKHAQFLVNGLGLFFVPTLLLVLALIVVRGVRRDLESYCTLEMLSLLVIFACLPPYVSFSLYFGCLHSLRHLHFETKKSSHWKLAAVATLISLIVLGGVIRGFGAPSTENVLKSLFVLLSGLTLPHMLLVEVERRGYKL